MSEVNVSQLNAEHSSDWKFIRAELNSSRAFQPLDIRNVITDFEVYEHIDKPYITGKLVVNDAQRVYERFDFQGGETFTVEISRSHNQKIPSITKTFIVDEVIDAGRVNETVQTLMLHLIEDVGFSDVLANVNRSYTGQPQTIMQKISTEYLDKEIIDNAADNVENSMRVIIPNLSPIEAMAWLKNRSTTVEGYPFFLYSTFAVNKYYLMDLGSLLSQPVINKDAAFTYSQGVEVSETGSRLFKIHDYKLANVENISSLIHAGYIGANHSFHNITTGSSETIKFDVHFDIYNKIDFNKRQKRPLISTELKHKDKILSDFESRNISNVFATRSFNDVKSYGEENTRDEQKRSVVANAMKHLLTKAPMEITVEGREFLNGSSNYSIGNNIKVIFKGTADDGPSVKIDRKMSGDYIIHSARHVFSVEKCFSILLISKIANYNDDSYPVG